MAGLRARTITLAHDPMLVAERCKLWHEHYQPQSLISEHLTTECARSSLLADQVVEFHQAELEEQARREQKTWLRRERRRVRYLGGKLNTRPAEALAQLQGFGEGVGFLVKVFEGLIGEVRTGGYLTPEDTRLCVQVCGSTQEPASIGRNPLAYTVLINNLGGTPNVSAADIDPWLVPVRRPAALRDRPRHSLLGADPDECRMRLLKALEAELLRLRALADRVREEVDIPSLCQALNRVCILTDESARRAACSHTEARVTFRQASNDLVKALERDRKNGVGHSSSVPGPLPAGDRAEAEAPAKAAVPEETGSVEAGFESQGAGPADGKPGLPEAPDEGPVPADRREDGFFPPKPEKMSDAIMPGHDELMTYVDARVSGSGCAKMRKTEAQAAPDAAQTGARTAANAPAGKHEVRNPNSETSFPKPEAPSREAQPAAIRTVITPAPGPVHEDPLAAVIAKYQKEFDVALRPYDHLE